MPSSQETVLPFQGPSTDEASLVAVSACAELTAEAFGAGFSILDTATGDMLQSGESQPKWNWYDRLEMCRAVTRRGRPEFVAEESPLVALALPLSWRDDDPRVAVGLFLSRPLEPNEDLGPAARTLGMDTDEAVRWAADQQPWSPDVLQHTADLVSARLADRLKIEKLSRESSSLTANLSGTYEEISLLHELTQNLKLSENDEELGNVALEWLENVVPAKTVALLLTPVVEANDTQTQRGRTEPLLLTRGDCPLDDESFLALIKQLGLSAQSSPRVANLGVTGRPEWPDPRVRQIVVVPLAEGDNLFGWLAAVNHISDGEFGTVEASLMSSVGTILGIHSGNLELYRKQSEMFAGVVRALASAIDAKDQYTRGHSDRVAQVSVRLARELGCDEQFLTMIYLSGLLHDVGKIGIDDQVLRKPGKLTDEEYEHIKRHVTVGHRILMDLRKMGEVLPVVLHHHESWDGSGYPEGLAGEKIPFSARIVAVADSFDAMSSDRPYRKGMPDEKIDTILREGACRQWDPVVIDAFFHARDDIRLIVSRERHDLDGQLERLT
ncbi:MAG: HD-GYP domain-containing protein [Pirellulales bacterium]|nr:HD-GYP domain-containing protein [Pirellulales bacterium]